MASVSEADLHHVILINGSAQSNEWRKAGALARGELERRNAEAAKTLAMKTTCISAAMGILGVVVGAFLGFWLSPSGSSIGGANATEHEVESQSH
jgi:hypothetical protein